MKSKTTEELRNEIKAATDIEDFLITNKENMYIPSLSEHLNMLLKQKGIKKADVLRGSLLGRAYIYRIFTGDKIPSRDKLIAIAFGMHLSDEETQYMLKLSGNRELYARDERDALILFSLQHKQTILEINEMLFEHRLAILNTSKE